jgi:hypothetical protein
MPDDDTCGAERFALKGAILIMFHRRFRLLSVTLFALLLTVVAVHADTYSTTETYTTAAPYWSTSQLFPLFYDPGYSLTSITASLDASMTGEAAFSDGGHGYAEVFFDVTSLVSTTDPGPAGDAAGAGLNPTGPLEWDANYPYDSYDTGVISASQTVSWTSTDAGDLTFFTGSAPGQTVAIPVSAEDNSYAYLFSGASGYAHTISDSASVTLTYDYTKNATPEPATLGLFSLGLGMLGLLRRRRR